nr:hypothetical protein [Tanacetum cinerariifolium]
ETTLILKTFITGLENQLSLKVKVIRIDNGTEFKNSDLNQFCGLKGIKREFIVPRTPQQNGIAEKKNRVLVTKPHNKTPYDLLHGRTHSIGFIRPFGCPVTILNTLDHLGKFQGKVDEGFLVGYSMCSKAFRVFNSRTCIVQETLHLNFLENNPNVAGAGPTWLFDIDSLSGTMNYHPVFVANQTNSGVGFQDSFDAAKAGEEITQTYVLFPAWSAGYTNPQDNDKDALVDGKEHGVDIQKFVSADIHLSRSSAQTRKQADKTEREDKGKTHVESFIGYRDLNAEFEECSNNSSNGVNAASSSVPTVGHNFINSTNNFSAAEADINNLESFILVSPILTTRIHKDHPISQIIGDLSLTTQTRSMVRAVKDQGKSASTLIDAEKPLLKDPDGKDVDVHTYRSMIGSLMYLTSSRPDIMFACKKQTVVATSSTEAEYVAAASVCAQVLWIQNQLLDYGAVLYGTIEEKVYVCQPLGFEDPDHPNKVYKVVKALYGLHQAPKAWYETLATYLLKMVFKEAP